MSATATARTKILVVSGDASAKGCANRSMTDAIRALSDEHDFQLLTLTGDRSVYELPAGVEVVSGAPGARPAGVLGKLLRIISGLPRLLEIIERTRPDVIMSFLPRPNVVNVLLKLVSRRGYKCVVCEHNFTSVQFSTGLPRRAIRFAIKQAYRRADLVIVVADELARDVELTYGVPAARIRTVHPSIDLASVLRLAAHDVDSPVFPSPVPVVLTVGRLIAQKNQDLLIRAFALARRRVACRLAILGEGPLRDDLAGLVRRLDLTDDVFFVGWHDNPFSFMRRATLTALSSNHEGFPLVLAEAMACGSPIVSTDCPSGPAEMLQGGRAGLLVPMNDPQALADALVKMLRHPDLRAELASRGRIRARDFDVPVIAEAYRRALGLPSVAIARVTAA